MTNGHGGTGGNPEGLDLTPGLRVRYYRDGKPLEGIIGRRPCTTQGPTAWAGSMSLGDSISAFAEKICNHRSGQVHLL